MAKTRYDRGANRSQTLVHERGLRGGKHGPAGPAISLSMLDHDTRAQIRVLFARGQSPEEIAMRTGCPLAVVRIVKEGLRDP